MTPNDVVWMLHVDAGAIVIGAVFCFYCATAAARFACMPGARDSAVGFACAAVLFWVIAFLGKENSEMIEHLKPCAEQSQKE